MERIVGFNMLISIKGKFVKEILKGTKTIELRKSMPKISAGSKIIIYETAPKMQICAYCRLVRIIKLPVAQMWVSHKSKLGITFEEYNSYYSHSEFAIGIEFSDVVEIKPRIDLRTVKDKFKNFQPPQTFKYLDDELLSDVLNIFVD